MGEALLENQHTRSERVIAFENGESISQYDARQYVLKACKRAKLPSRGIHSLRHTFCSHLAMRGAPASTIQKVAGHKDLNTTQRYIHINEDAVEAAIRLLDDEGNLAA
ncbi:hypothetical protein CSA17_06625 [bacterium DOLJORAL78_65_58]|nr:MAG: hypothetical protein CSA17_06625 [bacterium DOLJORAL78_65_58]